MRYAELTCTPYTSVAVGVPIEGYTEAIEDARVAAERDLGHRAALDLRHPRRERAAGCRRHPRLRARTTRPTALVGFGLGGPEVGVPRPQFKPHFDAARAAGLHSVPHAGETTGPETVWDALRELGAERIGHGTSSAQDPALLGHLAEHRIPLEVCPSSNIATRAVATLDEHPLRAFRDAGVVVTINSDDPPMFGTTLNREYEIAADLLDLDEAGVADLARTAVRVSFAPDDVKDRILGEIDASRWGLNHRWSSSERSERLETQEYREGTPKALEAHTSQGRPLCTTSRSCPPAATRSACTRSRRGLPSGSALGSRDDRTPRTAAAAGTGSSRTGTRHCSTTCSPRTASSARRRCTPRRRARRSRRRTSAPRWSSSARP